MNWLTSRPLAFPSANLFRKCEIQRHRFGDSAGDFAGVGPLRRPSLTASELCPSAGNVHASKITGCECGAGFRVRWSEPF